jgi:hypothetical protein
VHLIPTVVREGWPLYLCMSCLTCWKVETIVNLLDLLGE